MRTRTRFVLCIGLAFGLGLPVALPAQTTSRITIAHWGTEKILIYLPLYVAIDGGFLQRHGLQATLLYSGNDDQVFAAVRSGAADFGVGDPAFAAINRARGGGGKVIAPLVTSLTNWGVVRRESDITQIDSFSQLRGLRITSFPEPSTTYTVLSNVNKTLSADSFLIVQTAFGSELAALARNRADLAMLLEPQASIAEATGFRVVLSLADKFGPFLLTGVTTTDAVLESRPDEAAALLRALDETFRFIRANPDSAANIVALSFPTLDKSIVRRAVRRLINDGAVPTSVVIPAGAWNAVLALRVESGELPALDLGTAALDTITARRAIALGVTPRIAKPITLPGGEPRRTWMDWYGWFADTIGIVTALIILFVWLRWLRGVRVLTRPLSKQEREAVSALVPVLSDSGSRVLRHEATTRISDSLPGLSQAEIEELISRLVRFKIIQQHGSMLSSPVDVFKRETRVRLLSRAYGDGN